MNPLHLCGECSESGPVCCDQGSQNTNRCDTLCRLRLMFSVQPYGAPALDVKLPVQMSIETDNIAVIDQGLKVFNLPSGSNPYTMELSTWTVSTGGYDLLTMP